LCLFVLLGCATTQDVGRVQWELNELRLEIKKIKRKTRSLEARLPGLDQQGQIDKKLEGLEDSQKATAKAVSDLLIKVQDLSADVQNLTGRLEETRYLSEKGLKEITEDRQMLVAQIKELELAVDELKKRLFKLETTYASLERAKQESGKVEKKRPLKPDVKDVYMVGYKAFKEGNTKKAREKFMSVLRDYPENEYSDNARFWIAESYYKDGNYEDAILAYEELFKKNPNSDKIPGAMLKQGLAFYELKDEKTGRIILERLIEKFPDSEAAKTAQKKLRESTPSKTKKYE
jgi:tol-pal system protein YbgF